jgi:MoxR-like ATPase
MSAAAIVTCQACGARVEKLVDDDREWCAHCAHVQVFRNAAAAAAILSVLEGALTEALQYVNPDDVRELIDAVLTTGRNDHTLADRPEPRWHDLDAHAVRLTRLAAGDAPWEA